MSHTPPHRVRGTRTVDGVTITVSEQVWPDKSHTFAAFLADGTELTTGGSFDTLPTQDDLLDLLSEHRGLWHCTSCSTTIGSGEHDLIADHMRDCYDASEH